MHYSYMYVHNVQSDDEYASEVSVLLAKDIFRFSLNIFFLLADLLHYAGCRWYAYQQAVAGMEPDKVPYTTTYAK